MFSCSLVTTEISYYLWCSGQYRGNLSMKGSFFWCRLSSWGEGGGEREGGGVGGERGGGVGGEKKGEGGRKRGERGSMREYSH